MTTKNNPAPPVTVRLSARSVVHRNASTLCCGDLHAVACDRLTAAIETRDREAEAREAGLRKALKRITGPCSSQRDGSSACDKPQPWDGKIYDPESWCFKCIARNALAGTRAGMRR